MFMTRFKRGDIVLVLFPNSDGVTFKKRPALIVQADNLATGLAQTIVALVTSNMARAGHPSRLLVSVASSEGQKTGLRTDSVIVTDNLATVRDVEITAVLGVWPGIALLDAALRHTFGL
jgi:mRNA interferase MazF